jgi:hypothetical protein
LAKEWRDRFISTVNERVGSLSAKLLALNSHPLDTIETYIPKESKTLANELALTSFSYPIEEPKTSASKLVVTSFSHLVEDDMSADELNHTTYTKPAASKKRLGTALKKTVSKDLRYSTSTSSRRRQSKK